jgi:hypothetical protein
MKKTLIAILALAAVACNKAEVIDSNPGEAIAFGDAFVDNATKAATDPSYNATNLNAFKVYGAVQGVNIYNGNTVTKGEAGYGEAWTVTDAPTQYWIAGASYIFDAVVDATEIVTDKATGLPTTLKYNTNTQKDMLHNRVTTVGKPTDNNGLVAFTFTHLLSKVKFTVTNNTAETATGYRYTITDIAITAANLTGDYAVAGTWSNVTTGSYSISDITVASNATADCTKEVLIIPGTNMVGMTFKVNVEMYNGTEWKTITTTPKTYTNVIALAANTAYNFNVTVGLDDQIQFTARPVNSWTTNAPTPLQ